MERILNKIQKKIDQIEKLHDKESLLCEEVKDLIEEIREDNVEESIEAEDLDDEEFEARQILYKADHMKAFLGLLHCHKSELLFKEQMRKLKSTQTKRKKNVR